MISWVRQNMLPVSKNNGMPMSPIDLKIHKKGFDIMNDFPERLRSLRRERGYTQTQLCEALALEHLTISRYEAGKLQPSTDVLCKIADYFNVSIDNLVGRTKK